jgi:hypothetical protein
MRDRFWRFIGRFDPFAKGYLTPRDLRRHPIWEYATNTEGLPWRDETWRRPLKRKTIPWGELSLTVAATMTIRSGQRFDGDAYVSTDNGLVDVPAGSIVVGDRGFSISTLHAPDWFTPEDLAFAREVVSTERQQLAAALGAKVGDVFPIRWTLKVPLEGETEPRSGQFFAEPGP